MDALQRGTEAVLPRLLLSPVDEAPRDHQPVRNQPGNDTFHGIRRDVVPPDDLGCRYRAMVLKEPPDDRVR